MPPGLQKKLGPLKVWQWAAIGGAIGIFLYIRNRNASEETPATGELFGGTGTGAFGPIDPETGVPYAFEGGGSGGANQGSGESLDQFLQRVGQLQELFPHEREPGTETEVVIEKEGRAAQAEKSKEARDTGKHPATSTGSAASAGGKSHHSAPHPGTRIGIGGAKAVTGKNAGKQQGGGAQGHTKQKNTATKQHHDKQPQHTGGNGGGRNRGGGNNKKRNRR